MFVLSQKITVLAAILLSNGSSIKITVAVADFGMEVAKVTPIDSNLKRNVKAYVWSLLAEVCIAFQNIILTDKWSPMVAYVFIIRLYNLFPRRCLPPTKNSWPMRKLLPFLVLRSEGEAVSSVHLQWLPG